MWFLLKQESREKNQLTELLRRLVWDLFKQCRTLVGNEILWSLLLFSHLLRTEWEDTVGTGKSSWWQSAFEVHFGSTDSTALPNSFCAVSHWVHFSKQDRSYTGDVWVASRL